MATKPKPGTVSFTHEWYESFLRDLLRDGYDFRRFSSQPTQGDIFLRHDVDLSVDTAKRMAQIESKLGLQSTYCLGLSSPFYDLHDSDQAASVHDILELGHDIGLYFSTHDYWEDAVPDRNVLESRVREEQSVLETIVPEVSSAVSFSSPPPWLLGRSLDGFQNVYAADYFTDIEYHADTNQRWRDEPPVIGGPGPIQILVHTGLWGENDEPFETRVEQAAADACRHQISEQFFDRFRL